MATSLDPIVVVSVKDPALDMSPEEIEAYQKSRDPALIKCKAGLNPVKHYVRPMRADSASLLEGTSDSVDRVTTYYRIACHKIEDADGKVVECTPKDDLERWTLGRSIAKREWLTRVADIAGLAAIIEVGLVVSERACMRKDERGPLW